MLIFEKNWKEILLDYLIGRVNHRLEMIVYEIMFLDLVRLEHPSCIQGLVFFRRGFDQLLFFEESFAKLRCHKLFQG